MIRFSLTYVIVLASSLWAFPQDSDTTSIKSPAYLHWIQGEYQAGSVLQTNEFLRGEYESGQAIHNFQSISFSFGWQTNGKKLWHSIYGNPAWGLGIYHAWFGRPDDMGAPIALYGFYSGPFKRWKRFAILYDMNLGYSFNWVPFDEETNVYQISLGDDKAVYVNLGVRFAYQLSDYFDVDLGFAFSHFSNGSTVKPNKGVNIAAPHLALRYHLKGQQPENKIIEVPKHIDFWEWVIAATYGGKQVAFDTTGAEREIDRRYLTVNYTVIGLSTGVYRQFSHKSKVGGGLDFIYDESFTAVMDEESKEVTERESSFSDRIAVSIYGSYELVANRLSFLVEPGLYIIRKERPNEIPAFYQRVGIKYHILPNLFVGVNIRAYNFMVADFVEWKLGYRMKWGY